MEKLIYSNGGWVPGLYSRHVVMDGTDHMGIATFDVSRTNSKDQELIELKKINNARLTIAAVNACVDLNEDNPILAANAINEAVQVLRNTRERLNRIVKDLPSLSKDIAVMDKVLENFKTK